MQITITAAEAIEKGIWDEVCGLKGFSPYCVNEGLMESDHEIHLSSEEAGRLGIGPKTSSRAGGLTAQQEDQLIGEYLRRIVDRCQFGVYLEINSHRDNRQTVQEHLDEVRTTTCRPAADPETMAAMVKADTVISIQAYPDSPVGFHKVYAHSFEEAAERMFALLEMEQQEQQPEPSQEHTPNPSMSREPIISLDFALDLLIDQYQRIAKGEQAGGHCYGKTKTLRTVEIDIDTLESITQIRGRRVYPRTTPG